ncbi:MAG: flagellar motor protein MotB [Deltaproteobacteria bacterium]|nr:flagellar motor protein MotB [Deltaproteobacteria bacterium]
MSKKKPETKDRDVSVVMFLSLNMILLAFFILLVALSTPSKEKEQVIFQRVREAFSSFGGRHIQFGEFTDMSGVSTEENTTTFSQDVEDYLGELSFYVEENRRKKDLTFEVTAEGTYIHFSSGYGFYPGSDKLNPESLPVLDSLFNLVIRTTNPIRIEGHTSTAPPLPGSPFKDNWRLSAMRALAVFQHYMGKGMPARRMSVAGYGATRPLASNLSPAGRDRNERVTILMMGKITGVGDAPPRHEPPHE